MAVAFVLPSSSHGLRLRGTGTGATTGGTTSGAWALNGTAPVALPVALGVAAAALRSKVARSAVKRRDVLRLGGAGAVVPQVAVAKTKEEPRSTELKSYAMAEIAPTEEAPGGWQWVVEGVGLTQAWMTWFLALLGLCSASDLLIDDTCLAGEPCDLHLRQLRGERLSLDVQAPLCAAYGCGQFVRGHPCQCTAKCSKYGNCCSDYQDICEGTDKKLKQAAAAPLCANLGCSSKYKADQPCQCTAKCSKYGNCGGEMHDDDLLGPMNLQLVILNFWPAKSKDVENLIWASEENYPEDLDVLLQTPLDPNIPDRDGRSALHSAAFAGHGPCLSLLLEASADKDAWEKSSGHTPLHVAALSGKLKVVGLLLQAGADKEKVTRSDGWTPLHCAAWTGRSDVVRLLLEAGARRDARTRTSLLPLDLAQDNGHGADITGAMWDSWGRGDLDLLQSMGVNTNYTTYHPALKALIISNEPDLKASTAIARLGQMQELYRCLQHPEAPPTNYLPTKNDVLSAFRKRWVHSFNTAAPGHVVEARRDGRRSQGQLPKLRKAPCLEESLGVS
eukprot:Skav206116  [mRNA]  locus=scaffold172:84733:112494:+ [translate_table: standard]